MDLTSKNVESVFADCLFRGGEKTDTKITGEDRCGNTVRFDWALTAEGIMADYRFHPGRIGFHREDIAAMLSGLPAEFQKDSGGGMSFLNACDDSNGEQWTGLHSVMEHLFVLGLASKKVRCLMPRDMWKALPGGMPYYVVL